ncbi:hypothetical protein OAS02_04895 [Flavobacteriaceae bacterium]|nr:hypothetical protein [Flavobacteriaceae bacterium]
MRKLIALSVLIFFACSSNDDSNSTAQLFLEKYDGVVWNEDLYDSDPDYSYKIVFTKTPPAVTFNETYMNDMDCYVVPIGSSYTDENGTITTSVVESTENTIVLDFEEDYQGDIYLYRSTISVQNNENSMVVETSEDGESYTEYYSRTNLNNPCN